MSCELCTDCKSMCIFALYVSTCSSHTCLGAHPCELYLHGYIWCIYTHLGLPSFPCVHAVYCVLRPVNVSDMCTLMLMLWTYLFVLVCVTHGCGTCVTKCCVERCVLCDMGPHWFVVHMRSPCLGTLYTLYTFVVTHTLSVHCVVVVDVVFPSCLCTQRRRWPCCEHRGWLSDISL